jgi:hypothetical protein
MLDQMDLIIITKSGSLARQLIAVSAVLLYIAYTLLRIGTLPLWLEVSYIGFLTIIAICILLFGIGAEIRANKNTIMVCNSGRVKIFKKTHLVSEIKIKKQDGGLILIDKDGFGISSPIPPNFFTKHDWDKLINYLTSVKLI